jgi:hypothetical protein
MNIEKNDFFKDGKLLGIAQLTSLICDKTFTNFYKMFLRAINLKFTAR